MPARNLTSIPQWPFLSQSLQYRSEPKNLVSLHRPVGSPGLKTHVNTHCAIIGT